LIANERKKSHASSGPKMNKDVELFARYY